MKFRLFPTILRLWPMAALLLFAVSCADDAEEVPKPKEPDAVSVETPELTALPEGGEVVIVFNANTDWTMEVPNTNEHFQGQITERSGKAGAMRVGYVALPNTSGAARSTTIKITAGRASATVVVRQEDAGVTLPSEAEVRAYLMRLYEMTDGPNWRFKGNWGSDLPLNKWGSEVRYENGLLSLNLGERYLKGEIDLSGCDALVSLRCAKNQISKIDVSGCRLLKEIDCTNNSMEEINFEGCLSLTDVNVPYNNLQRLDVGWSKTLTRLYANHNRLTELDLSECVMLETVDCFANRLSKLEIPHRQRLKDVFCYENEIRTLDIGNAPIMEILNCGDNELESLNVKGSPRLRWIYCYNNRLTELDTSDQMDALSCYYCFSNRLTSLDMTGYRNLSELHCSDNDLTSLTVAGCRKLRWLYCSYNRLETLDLAGFDDVFERLDCSYNRLREVEHITDYRYLRLWCQGNRIGGEIPSHFDNCLEFEYDRRYEYRPETGTYNDLGYGWYYPGEPASMKHERLP